jgi:hypothetical protein
MFLFSFWYNDTQLSCVFEKKKSIYSKCGHPSRRTACYLGLGHLVSVLHMPLCLIERNELQRAHFKVVDVIAVYYWASDF